MSFTTINFFMILGFYMLMEPYWIQEKHDMFYDDDIPVQFEEFKIVFVSDIHHGPYLNENRVVKLVDQINHLQPDILLLGGDYVHRDPKYIESFFRHFKKVESNYGVYAVLGNHDHWEDANQTRIHFESAGFVNIDNKSVWLKVNNDKIKIGGVGDMWENDQLIDSTIFDVETNDFVILISHNPDYVEKMKTDKVDLVLAGHTHGGQVSFFGEFAPVLPSKYGQKYRTGLVKTENTTVIISNGVGTITPPIRFFTRPQINIITLKKKSQP